MGPGSAAQPAVDFKIDLSSSNSGREGPDDSAAEEQRRRRNAAHICRTIGTNSLKGMGLLYSVGKVLKRKYRKAAGQTMKIPEEHSLSREYAVSSPFARWYEVYDEAPVQLQEPRNFGDLDANFERWMDDIFPPLGVVELPDGYSVGLKGWVVTNDEILLSDQSWYGRHVGEMKLSQCFPIRSNLGLRLDPSVPVDQLDGTCLSLASDWSTLNYAHFLLDGLCRLELFRKAGFELSDVDHVFVPSPNPAWSRFLDILGISDKVVEPQKRRAFQADTLIAPTFPGTRCVYPRFVVDFLRREFLSEPGGQDRRLYIPRTTTRQPANEDTLITILKEFGFEVFEPVEHENPPRVFSEAEIVVGAHGAGLADIAFCQPGTKILELIPSDHVRPYWYTLSEAADLEYSYLVGPSTKERPIPNDAWPRPSPYDFAVDEEDFRRAISILLGAN